MGRGQQPAVAKGALQVVDDHPAVSPTPNRTRWMRIPLSKAAFVSAERLPKYLQGSTELSFPDLSPQLGDSNTPWNLNSHGVVCLAKRPSDEYIAYAYTRSEGGVFPGLGATPQKAIESASASLFQSQFYDDPIPSEDDWKVMVNKAREWAAKSSSKGRRRNLFQDKMRATVIPAPTQQGWVVCQGLDDVRYEDDPDFSRTIHRISLQDARLVDKEPPPFQQDAFSGPAFCQGVDSVWVVAREEFNTDYETYSDEGLLQVKGAFQDERSAQEFALLQRTQSLGEEVRVQQLPVRK